MPDSPDTLEVTDHLALALVPGLGPKLTAALLARFGSAGNALRATPAELREIPHIGDTLASALAQAFRTVNTASEIELLQKHGVRPVPLGFADYPPPLARVPAPPPLLYFRGDWKTEDANAVGIVGSRSCTSYGLKAAGQLARGLVRAGFTVVSGLARGIDASAHRGALEGGGRTIAVLAGGLSKIYPPEHKELAEEIAANRGCLITETSMRMDPQPGMFPARNRIISGLSRAIIVVEANARSGALITAQHAAEQGREVYALPGPVDSPASAGCLQLIRNGARLVRSADDVIEDLQGLRVDRRQETGDNRQETESRTVAREERPAPEIAIPPVPELSPTEQRVFDVLATRRHADELARELGLAVGELSRTLMLLELKKLVRRLPGNFYERR
ncbi:MAG TPA: DNA-processing protein DprA [Gemmata sp.]|jgi:DNA processing protein|nr:DNA-processing protein DprA [Gemmata sp.]